MNNDIKQVEEQKEEFKKEMEEQREEVIKQLEEWNKNGFFEVNGRKYVLSKMTHQFRVEVLAIYSEIEILLLSGNYSFMIEDNFKKIIKKIEDRVLFDGMQISKRPQHWEEYEEDYIDFVTLSMKVICFPFYKKKLAIN